MTNLTFYELVKLLTLNINNSKKKLLVLYSSVMADKQDKKDKNQIDSSTGDKKDDKDKKKEQTLKDDKGKPLTD
jgi:hypothetical protein